MTQVDVALTLGDGSAPAMMEVACRVVEQAALIDDLEVVWHPAPMGWCAYGQYGDTCPPASLDTVKELGLVFFGGVGDTKLDRDIGQEHPEMMPETRALLRLRHELGLLVNVRPLLIPYELRHLVRVRPESIPECGVFQYWMRFLKEDGYHGTADLLPVLHDLTDKVKGVDPEQAKLFLSAVIRRIGLKRKAEVTGGEEIVSELAYFTRPNILTHARYAFDFARRMGLPVVNAHKANILARSRLWKLVVDQIHAEEFPDIPLRDVYIDAAMSMLYDPAAFNAVIICGNEHGDIGSDGALGIFTMGLMASGSVNPWTNAALFESGAGTCPQLAGRDEANPLGRILTGAMLLQHVGAAKGANAIVKAVNRVLADGWRTADLLRNGDDRSRLVGTQKMGELVSSCLSSPLT